jgi:hypothetical protein
LGNSLRDLGSAFANGRNNPAWAIHSSAKIFEETLTATTEGLVEVAQSIENISGGGFFTGDAAVGISALITGGKLGAVITAVGGKLLGEAIEARADKLGDLARLERPQETGRYLAGVGLGLGSDAMRIGAGVYGLSPDEVASVVGGFGRGAGGAGALAALGPANLFQLLLSGISPDAAARFVGLGTLGGGARGGLQDTSQALGQAIGYGERAGLRGGKIDEILLRLSTAATTLAERGLTLDLGSAIGAASALSGLSPSFAGMGGIRGVTGLSDMAGGARGALAGQFGQLGDAALLAAAFRQGGGLEGALSYLDLLQGDPGAVPDAINGILGGGLASLAAFSPRFSTSQARALSGVSGRLGGGAPSSFGGADPGALNLSRQFAEQERGLLELTAGMPGNEVIIRALYETNALLIQELSQYGIPLIALLNELVAGVRKL